MLYEKLIKEAQQHCVYIYEKPLKPRIKGLQSDNVIWINKYIPSTIEKACILAEELGHYHTSCGDILDQTKTENKKQELRARQWAYKKLVPLYKIVEAHKTSVRNRHELADYLNVTEIFLDEAINWYKSKYGLFVSIENFTLCFEPLGVLEMFD